MASAAGILSAIGADGVRPNCGLSLGAIEENAKLRLALEAHGDRRLTQPGGAWVSCRTTAEAKAASVFKEALHDHANPLKKWFR